MNNIPIAAGPLYRYLTSIRRDERVLLREKRILVRVRFSFAFTFTVAIKLEQNSRFYRLIP